MNAAVMGVPAGMDAGRHNMLLLIQLRWIAAGGQLVTIALVYAVMGIGIPLLSLLIVPALLVAINLASLPLLRRRAAVTNTELTLALLVDVAALAWQLHQSGGLANPFASLFLLQVVIGALLLRPASTWAVTAAALLALGAVAIHARPLDLPEPWRHDPLGLYLRGSLVSFALIAVLLVAFVTRMARNLRARDAALAAARQRAAEEDHIVRMGLLASGAAHELGTPLASLSVLIGDWRHMPALARNRELREDLADMEAAVQRCKAIVSGILMSAGEARGEAPQVTTMRAFLAGLVEDARAIHRPETFHFDDRVGTDLRIVSDPALRQVIANVIDNAADVSPDWISLSAAREADRLVIAVADRGPGFPPDMLAGFGQPYRSTKAVPGRGLGLFLLVNVVRKLGGDASALNRPEGGACVRIRLPIEALAYRPDVEAKAADGRSAAGRDAGGRAA